MPFSQLQINFKEHLILFRNTQALANTTSVIGVHHYADDMDRNVRSEAKKRKEY